MTRDPHGAVTIAVGDIGGTNARFALATLRAGEPPELGSIGVHRAADYPDLASAWRAFASGLAVVPKAAAFAVAAPVRGEVLRFTNSPWTIDRRRFAAELGLDDLLIINDFGAMAHAVATLPETAFLTVAGPDAAFPATGTISVIGPGTGLGISIAVRQAGRAPAIAETEGGHVGFAPVDALEQAIHARFLARHGRVSTERVIRGAGLQAFYDVIAAEERAPPSARTDEALWKAALDRSDMRASAALDRYCLAFGSIVGDLALAHGAQGVALAGGLSTRMLARLRMSGFGARFVAKGRYVDYMSAIPVRLVDHPQPGLLGAAAAFAARRLSPPIAG